MLHCYRSWGDSKLKQRQPLGECMQGDMIQFSMADQRLELPPGDLLAVSDSLRL
jgi:hypothetical protein